MRPSAARPVSGAQLNANTYGPRDVRISLSYLFGRAPVRRNGGRSALLAPPPPAAVTRSRIEDMVRLFFCAYCGEGKGRPSKASRFVRWPGVQTIARSPSEATTAMRAIARISLVSTALSACSKVMLERPSATTRA